MNVFVCNMLIGVVHACVSAYACMCVYENVCVHECMVLWLLSGVFTICFGWVCLFLFYF